MKEAKGRVRHIPAESEREADVGHHRLAKEVLNGGNHSDDVKKVLRVMSERESCSPQEDLMSGLYQRYICDQNLF